MMTYTRTCANGAWSTKEVTSWLNPKRAAKAAAEHAMQEYEKFLQGLAAKEVAKM